MLYDYSNVFTGMDHTVEFISGLLSESPDIYLGEETPETTEKLSLENSLDNLDFRSIDQPSGSYSACAIDGGQGTIIRNSVFLAGVYRAGYVLFSGRERSDEYSLPLQLINLNRGEFKEQILNHYNSIFGCEPDDEPEFSGALSSFRSATEMSMSFRALESLQSGDILLLDGSLRSECSRIQKKLLDDCASNGIDVAAVTKGSTLLWKGGSSYLSVARTAGDKIQKDKCWYVRIGQIGSRDGTAPHGDVYIARLNRWSHSVFRVDLSRKNNRSASEIFSRLCDLSSDPFFLGYPYPLAAVHQMVRLSDDELLNFRIRLREKAYSAGIADSGWDALFADFHDTLNYDLTHAEI